MTPSVQFAERPASLAGFTEPTLTKGSRSENVLPQQETEMQSQKTVSSRIVVITASASSTSRSEKLARYVVSMLKMDYSAVDIIDLRTLPAAPLLAADPENEDISRSTGLVEDADGVVLVTPTYKGSYSGLLKVFIDLLPQYALRGKVVLPLATGGTIAHVQMLDHCLRPVLQSMWPRHVAQGCFVLDRHISVADDGQIELSDDGAPLLLQVIEQFENGLAAFGGGNRHA